MKFNGPQQGIREETLFFQCLQGKSLAYSVFSIYAPAHWSPAKCMSTKLWSRWDETDHRQFDQEKAISNLAWWFHRSLRSKDVIEYTLI